MSYILGIDLGTTTCKTTLLAPDGYSVTSESESYQTHFPHTGWAEQNPDEWWESVKKSINQVIETARCDKKEIAAIGLSGQMHGLILLDSGNQILRPSIIWSDKRSSVQSRRLAHEIPDIEKITLNKVLPAFTLPKLIWVRDNESLIFKKIRWILLPKDYVRFRMTGKFITEPSDASGTAMFDSRILEWSSRILDSLDIPMRWLPICMPSIQLSGSLTRSAALDLGLVPGIPIIGGAGDQSAQAVAMGAVNPGVLGMTIGTSGVIVITHSLPIEGSFCHALPQRWMRLNSMHSAGLCIRWYRDSFLPGTSYEEMTNSARDILPGSSNLTFLPFLLGEREAIKSSVPAGFLGVSVQHTTGHFIRAILEGVAYEFRRMIENWIDQGVNIDKVRLSGGGGKSRVWQSILANVLNLPIEGIDRDASFGAALIAGVGVGWWSSIENSIKAVSSAITSEEPSHRLVEEYMECYSRYINFYRVFSEASKLS